MRVLVRALVLAAVKAAVVGVGLVLSAGASSALAQSADLFIEASGPAETTAGATINYTVTVTNLGPDAATSTTVTVQAPAGVEFTAATGPGFNCSLVGGSGNTATCSRGTFPVGPVAISLTAVVDAGAAPGAFFTAIATVASPDDYSDENNYTSSTAQIPAPYTDLGVQITGPDQAVADSNVTYTVSATNGSAVDAPNAAVSFSVPSGLGLVSLSSAGGWSCSTPAVGADGPINCTQGLMAAGSTATFTLVASVPPDAPLGMQAQNFASVQAGILDVNSENDTAVTAFTVDTVANVSALSLAIGFGTEQFVAAGEVIDVSYTLTNTGSVVDLDNVSLTDTKVATTCPATTIAIGATMVCTGTYIVTDADMTAGSIDFAATASANGVSPLASATATITSGAGVVADAFDTMARDFVETRQKLIAAGIDTPGLKDRGSSSVSLAESGDGAVLNFSATTADLWERGPGAALAPERGPPMTFWAEGSARFHTRDEASGSFGLFGLGADYLASKDFLAGVALYVDYMRDESDDGEITGTGALIGPYVSLGLSEGVTLDASLFYGRSWNDASATVLGDDYEGSFETDRFIGELELQGEWMLDQLRVRPNATLYLASETADDYTVTNSWGGTVAVDGFTTNTIQLRTGVTVDQSFALENGLELTPEVGIEAGIGGSGEDFALDSGLGGLTLGATLAGDGWSLRGAADVDLDSTGFFTSGLSARLSGSF